MSRFLAVLLCSLLATTALAQPADGTRAAVPPDTSTAPADATVLHEDGASTVFLPNVFYTPETGLAGGAVGLHFFRLPGERADSRASTALLTLIYTWRGQIIAEAAADVYRYDERYELPAGVSFVRFPDQFYGVGPQAAVSDEETFTVQSMRAFAEPLARLRPGLYVGPTLHFTHQRFSKLASGGLLATHAVEGAGGGRTATLGARIVYDTREHPNGPQGGSFHQAGVRFAQSAWGSEYAFAEYNVDLRRYVATGPKGHVLALRTTATYAPGAVPFTQLPQLGGASLLRGYYAGRYRDHLLTAAQAEYRLPVYGRLGLVVFGSVGTVAATPRAWEAQTLRWGGGAGLRVALSKKERLNLRFDVGVGDGTGGTYITLAEAF